MKTRKQRLYEIIFESDTRLGKLFDIVLLVTILLSISAVMLESVREIEEEYGTILRYIEWFFTILFTVEYIVRILSVDRPLKYVFSFFGIIDLLSIAPTYLGLFLTNTHYFSILRAIRLLRVFRILKLARYLNAANILGKAIRNSREKIIVFVGVVLSVCIILGTIMFLIEGPEHGFTSIPRSIYWAIVTLTTVGFGDIAPMTFLGQLFASVLMILGYGIIAVPTGIVTSEMINSSKNETKKNCTKCGLASHAEDALYCKRCGNQLLV
jgi:voltage-gated potassium channel